MVTLYIEGGGDYTALKAECRQAFTAFFEKAGFKGQMPHLVACGGRQKAYEMFTIACLQCKPCLLLVDSESPVTVKSPWEHLALRKGDEWIKPVPACDEDCHLMVQCMESWFLCDKELLASYFGASFRENALPQHTNIEDSPKNAVLSGFSNASRTTTKPYTKGKHSFKLLNRLDPQKVFQKSPWAKRLQTELVKRLCPAAGV